MPPTNQVVPDEANGTSESLPKIDDRVTVAGYCAGTVKYVGLHKGDPAKGTRVLVHLDKAIGKNNGSVHGNHYSPELGANEGVLVKAEKVQVIFDNRLDAEDDDVAVPQVGRKQHVVCSSHG
jgi:dynactin complex subunit